MKLMGYMLSCMISFAIGFAVDNAITRVPREALAENDMICLERGIRSRFVENGVLPHTLADICDSEGRMSLTNHYGNPIEYSVTNDYIVTLRAYGFGGEHSPVKNYFVLQFDVREK